MPISKKRLAEIAAIADGDIDTSDIPEAGEEFFKKAKHTKPGRSTLLGLSAHVVGRSTGRFAVPRVSVSYARNGSSTKANALGMRPMQERAYEKRGEQYLLIKSPPASGKSRALMFIALDKLQNQGLKQAIIVVPEKTIGASFHDEPLTKFGFWADWHVEPKWNLCNAPGADNGGKVKSVGAFLASGDKVLVCTHATFRFAVDEFGVEAFDDRLIAVDEFHHVSANPDNKLGLHLGPVHRPRPGAYRRDDRLLFPGRRRGRADPAGRGEVRHRHLHLLRAAQRLRVSEAARHRLFLLRRLLRRRHPEGARPGREDDRSHPERQLAREHEGQDQGGRAHHRGAGRLAGVRPRDGLPAREDARGSAACGSPTSWTTTPPSGTRSPPR